VRVGFAFPLGQLAAWLGLAVFLLAVLVAVLRRLEQRRRERLTRFVEAKLASRLLVGYDATVRRPLFWVTALGFALLALAVAQPHWGQDWEEFVRRSHDVMVCLDTSESMRAANPAPSRMHRAKQKIGSLLDLAPGDRFGLVVFSGAAALQCPLTLDHGYLKAVLSAVNTDTISAEGTDIAAALREAVKVFRAEAEQSGVWDRDTRAILLISDGEQISGDAIEEAKAASDFARVHVIGVGDPEGATITLPEWMQSYSQGRRAAKTHLSKLDEDTLRKVAIEGEGRYVRTTPANADIDLIHELIEGLTARKVSSDLRQRLVNRYQWPLSLAILCFAGEGAWLAVLPWIRRSKTRRVMQTAPQEDFHA